MRMQTKLTLSMVVEHDTSYDPAKHWVYYFSDDEQEPTILRLTEEWADATREWKDERTEGQ